MARLNGEKGEHVKKLDKTRKRPEKEESPSDYKPRYRTEYAARRPQRAAARNRRVQMGETSENIQLVECEEFMAEDSETGFRQPFTVDIASEALLVMAFHSHLSEFEVIGLLAGQWDSERMHLVIEEAIPCQRADGSGARTSVELDPGSEVLARTEMAEKGMIGTGWYHSHPVFSATPSMKDIENQRNYQTLFRQEGSDVEPFIGLIVSPYDLDLPTPVSNTCGFFVLEKNTAGIRPFRLKSVSCSSCSIFYFCRYNVIDKLDRPPTRTEERCEMILDMLKNDPARVDLSESWKRWSMKRKEKDPRTELNKLDKLRLSLITYFKDEKLEAAQGYVDELLRKINQRWDVRYSSMS